MQNFISSFSPSSSFQFVDEQLFWEEDPPHRHDCHDPPHAVRVGFLDDQFPPRRLRGVARSDPWKAPAQVGFPGNATRRRRSPWVAGSGLWCSDRREDYLRRDWCGEDCHPEQVIHALAALGVEKIEFDAFVFTYWRKGYFASLRVLYASLIELIMNWHGSMTYLSMSISFSLT
jgi:hypothetical protein